MRLLESNSGEYMASDLLTIVLLLPNSIFLKSTVLMNKIIKRLEESVEQKQIAHRKFKNLMLANIC